jgi:hypothetical protein
MKEPYVAEELIRITVETYGVYLVFDETVLQLGAPFLVTAKGVSAEIRPSERKGNLSALWMLIGERVVNTDWSDTITFTFQDGSEIKILPAPGIVRGSIVGKKKVEGAVLWEDF